MAVTASTLRQNVYRILDQVLETGVPVEIVRRRQRLMIVSVEAASADKLERLKSQPRVFTGDPQDLVHIDWSKEWKP
jgi:PHD/YefM family antitoxin component YafN of YafNO toxin-antitoxin module